MLRSRIHILTLKVVVPVAVVLLASLATAQTPPVPPASVELKAPVLTAAEQQRRTELMAEPYRVAAAIVAAQPVAPKFIATVGAFEGEFLSVFLDQFPQTPGQYTEAATSNAPLVARKKLARFGDRVTFVVGCPSRDISTGCVPAKADVILTEWLSTHQNLDGMYKVYKAAAAQLPVGGWMITLDHVSFGGTAWDEWLTTASKQFRPAAEAPPIHHPDYRVPTADEELGAMRAAGLEARIVWQSFGSVLLMGRKR